MALPFTQIPTIHIPANFHREMPGQLAQWAAEHGPIFRLEGMPVRPTVCMMGTEATRFITHSHNDHFSAERGYSPIFAMLGRGLFTMDGEEHDHHRKLLLPPFKLSHMINYYPLMTRVVQERSANWEDRGEFDLQEAIRQIVLAIAVEAVLGLRDRALVDQISRLYYTITEAESSPDRSDRGRLSANNEMAAIIMEHINRRRRTPDQWPQDDTLAILVNARDQHGRPLTDHQILGHARVIIGAAHVTTTTALTWLMYLLAQHPEHANRVRSELDGMAASAGDPIPLDTLRAGEALRDVVNEQLRIRCPIGNLPRGVIRDFEFGGYAIPAGTLALWSVVGEHWNPDVFKNPEQYDPDRFASPRSEDKAHPTAFVPFGHGERTCLGINFAQTEIRVVAAHILRTYDIMPLPRQHVTVDYTNPDGYIPHGVRVRVKRRARERAFRLWPFR